MNITRNSAKWSQMGNLENVVSALALGLDGDLYAASSWIEPQVNEGENEIKKFGIAKFDYSNNTWNQIGDLWNLKIKSFVIDEEGHIYVLLDPGDEETNPSILFKWDGNEWKDLKIQSYETGIQDMVMNSDGNLYLAGSFATGSDNFSSGIYKQDGDSWTLVLKEPATGLKYAQKMSFYADDLFAVFSTSPSLDSPGALAFYILEKAAGSGVLAGSVTGSNFSSFHIALAYDNFCVAGSFDNDIENDYKPQEAYPWAEPTKISFVKMVMNYRVRPVRWEWHTLDQIPISDIRTFVAGEGGRLYMGGGLSTFNQGRDSEFEATIAEWDWDASQWQPMGEGFNKDVLSIVDNKSFLTGKNDSNDRTGVYAGGRFSKSGENDVNYVARLVDDTDSQ